MINSAVPASNSVCLLDSLSFCDKRISGNVYITLAHSSTLHCLSRYEALGKFRKPESRKTMAHLLKLFHTRAAQFCGFSREFVTLRVAPFVLLSAHENLNSRQEQTADIVLTYKILKMQKWSKTICSDIFVMVVFPSLEGCHFLGFEPQFSISSPNFL